MNETRAPSAAPVEDGTTVTTIKEKVDVEPTKNATRPISRYVRDFESLFMPIRIEMLRNRAQSGQLRHCQFRSLCWRYFLGCLPSRYDEWIPTCEAKRRQYDGLKKKHQKPSEIGSEDELLSAVNDNSPAEILSPVSSEHQSELTDLGASDKLSTAQRESTNDSDGDHVKSLNQCDYKNVLRTIERDVVRTFPDMEFFRQTEIQAILSNILFNFASENPKLSYKQGMHELLATLLYVAHTDTQNCVINYEGDYANETIASLLNIKFLEHDVYHLFRNLMQFLESWYQNDEIILVPESETVSQLKNHNINRFPSTTANRSSSSSITSKLTTRKPQVGSVLGSKLMKISVNIVKSYDSELFYHLEALQIAPQIYGIRWMRLLFGREFEFLDLLTLWDAIICDEDSRSLVDYVFASMLITIRDELVNGDYTHCLNNLMRYQFKDVSHVIKLALYLRDPINYSRPKPYNQFRSSRYASTSGSDNHQQRYSVPRAPQQMSVSSLTSKLSQQYISDKLQQPSGMGSGGIRNQTVLNPASTRRYVSPGTKGDQTLDKQHLATLNRGEAISSAVQGGIGYLAQQASRNLSNANNSAKNKLLPNINKFVTSIGQNIQDKTNFPPSAQWQNPTRSLQSRHTSGALVPQSSPQRTQSPRTTSTISSSPSSSSSREASQRNAHHQQYHHTTANDMILSTSPIIKEYEMREMQSNPSSSSSAKMLPVNQHENRFPLGEIGKGAIGNAFDVSTESYDDLHSIVDYCWRLLSEQIDLLQRCLPKEKSLHSEDEIFVALAQLKKVRDVLKGSLKLEDELESAAAVGSALLPGPTTAPPANKS